MEKISEQEKFYSKVNSGLYGCGTFIGFVIIVLFILTLILVFL